MHFTLSEAMLKIFILRALLGLELGFSCYIQREGQNERMNGSLIDQLILGLTPVLRDRAGHRKAIRDTGRGGGGATQEGGRPGARGQVVNKLYLIEEGRRTLGGSRL